MDDSTSTPNGSQSMSNHVSNEERGEQPNYGETTSRMRASRKRGRSKGIGDDLPAGQKMIIQTNGVGIPNVKDKATEAFSTRLGIIARRDIPICFDTWPHVPKEFIDGALECLDKQFMYDYCDTIDTHYTRSKLNDAWRNYKNDLYDKHVKDKDPLIVKEGPAPDGIPLEDWVQFVDNCNSETFQAASERNKRNRSKQKMPSCTGRKLASVLVHELAVERGVQDSEIGRSEAYMVVHTRKDKTPQNPELVEKLTTYMTKHPESRATSVNDALAKVVGPDSRGHFRGMTGVCKTQVQMMEPCLKKNASIMERNIALETKIDNLEAKFDAKLDAKLDAYMAEFRSMFMNQGGPNTATASSHSSQATSVDNIYIGKECDIHGGWPLKIVAKGIVQEVNPNTVFGDRILEEDNYKVYVNVVLDPNSMLPCPHDEYFTTLGHVGQGSVIWPKGLLAFQPSGSRS